MTMLPKNSEFMKVMVSHIGLSRAKEFDESGALGSPLASRKSAARPVQVGASSHNRYAGQ